MSGADSLYSWGRDDMRGRVRRLEALVPQQGVIGAGRIYAAVDAGAVTSSGQVNTQTRLTAFGSIVPTTSNPYGFTVTTDDTSATIFYDGTNGSQRIKIGRPDGTYTILPPGSQTITGLTALTTYNILPFWTPDNSCGIGWVGGGVGSPPIAIVGNPTQAQQNQQTLYGREPLSYGSLTFKTTSGAPSTGGIGSGGDPVALPRSCVILGTDIDPIGNSPYRTIHHACSEWVWIKTDDPKGRSLRCTPDHPVFTSRAGRTDAGEVKRGDKLICDWGEATVESAKPHIQVCTKVEVKMDYGHLFWANGILSHNLKASTL